MQKLTEEVKKMTFAEAVKKVAEIADGRYHSIKFEMNVHRAGNFSNGRTAEVLCGLYMEGKNHVSGQTWEDAFEKLAALGSDHNPELLAEGVDEAMTANAA